MSECVVRMKIPKSCWDCPCFDDYGDYPRCEITNEQRGYNFPIHEKRMPNCPIICQLPEGHGRLGDLDELAKMVNAARIEAMQKGFDTNPYWLLGDIIAQAKTIVPAEAERSE